MSQASLTDSDRSQSLQRFGYTEREARFLCRAALHSGYFLRRQYSYFLGQENGGSVAQLIEKILKREHAQVLTYQQKTQIYHLSARPFYAVFGQSDNRNRRQHEPLTIKTKLMALDFVLAHSNHEYLSTEQEKLRYFVETLDLDRAVLPARVHVSSQNGNTWRYFVEKYPLFLEHPSFSSPSVVSFCYIDPGAVTLAGFNTFLAQYAPLLASLPKSQVLYVASHPASCEKAQRVFEHNVASGVSRLQQVNVTQMLDHFEARRLLETKQFASFDRARLIQFRDDRQRFSSPEFDTLYRVWSKEGAAVFRNIWQKKWESQTTGSTTFSSFVLEHSYDFFGSLAAS